MSALIVAVPTFRRQSIVATLASLTAGARLVPDRIVVVDNDHTDTARPLVEGFAARNDVPITYRHAPAGNISLARNAALDEAGPGTRLAFIDDDELAAADWLSELVAGLAPGVAAVFGEVVYTYPDKVPAWMADIAPHRMALPRRGDEILSGGGGNCLMDLGHPAMAGRRFDLDFGRTGGEDFQFFWAARQAGAQLAHAPRAITTEAVPEERLATAWLMARRCRAGQIYARVAALGWPGAVPAAAKWAVCQAMGWSRPPSTPAHWKWRLRGAFHGGVVGTALGEAVATAYGGAK